MAIAYRNDFGVYDSGNPTAAAYPWKDIKTIKYDESSYKETLVVLYGEGGKVLEKYWVPRKKENKEFLQNLKTISENHGIKVISLSMSVRICPICCNVVARNAQSCPACGFQFTENIKKEKRGIGFWGVVMAIIVAVLILSAG